MTTLQILYLKGEDSLHVLKYKHGEILSFIHRHKVIDDALNNGCYVKLVPFDDHLTIWIHNKQF